MRSRIVTATLFVATLVVVTAPVGRASQPSWQFSTPAAAGALYGISASATNDVWAVGTDGSPLVEHWNGTGWSVVSTPLLPFGGGTLRAVATLPSGRAWAVGTQTGAPDGRQWTLIETWTGTRWRVVPSPNWFEGDPADDNELRAVSAVSPSDVWAAGTATMDGSIHHNIIEHWDGSSWSMTGALSPGTQWNQLYGISMASLSAGFAVGEFASRRFVHPLAERWRNAQWHLSRIAASPRLSLLGVTTPSASQAWAVGLLDTGSIYPVIEHFVKGSGWTSVSPGVPGRGRLDAIAASSPSDMWAVGIDGEQPNATFFLHWDGTEWTHVAGPSSSSPGLWAVTTVPGSSEAWAVGADDNGTIILHYA